MQVHYNLLVGDKPVKNSLVLHTVPASTPLLPLKLDLMPAPPDIPCPAGVTGPSVQPSGFARQPGAALRAERRRLREHPRDGVRPQSGRPAGRRLRPRVTGPSRAVATSSGPAPTCTSWVCSFKMVLNPGTPQAKTILDVPDYNFHYQRAYNLKTPVPVSGR